MSQTLPTDLPPLRRTWRRVNGVALHVVEAGPPDGPPVVLLHGFPEFWYGWRSQIGPLAAAGHRVVVPDQRGYGLSDKPRGVGAYQIQTLTADVLGLLDALGLERAHIAGHDWGAAVAWNVALSAPGRVDRLAILNVPHPRVLARSPLRHPRQLLQSWYILYFQLPRLPEAMLGANHCRALARTLSASSAPGTFSEADLARYREAWAVPGALGAMLNWYRALRLGGMRVRGASQRVRVPTLILWGERDAFLETALAHESAELVDDVRLQTFPAASHWVQHEAAGEVNAALIEFLPAKL